MIPLGDDNTGRKIVPVVTWGLILLNVLMFLLEMAGGEEFIMKWAFVPSRFLANPFGEFPTLFTSMFMHAGIAHIVGNMLYLWIFGDNVEDRLGSLPFLIFYLVAGLAATFAQTLFDPSSILPNVGASGAIAGVLGAYILFFPGEKIKMLLGQSIVQLPALIVIGFWFLLQFFSGISQSSSAHSGEGGVAYMAHIGGFIGGLAIAFLYKLFSKANQV